MKQAARIAINRTVAGVHYPVDSMAGQLLDSPSRYLVKRPNSRDAEGRRCLHFDGMQYPVPRFLRRELYDATGGNRVPRLRKSVEDGGVRQFRVR